MEQKTTTPAMKGIVIALIIIVLSLVTYFTGQSGNEILKWISQLVLAVGAIWACISYAKELNGNVTFGNIFAHGFKTTAAATAIVLVYTVLAVKFITPGIVDIAVDIARKKMEEKNNLSQDQIDTYLGFTRKFFLPLTMAAILVMYLICGVIASLIGAAIAKKNPNPTPFAE